MCKNMFLQDSKFEQLYGYNASPKNGIERKQPGFISPIFNFPESRYASPNHIRGNFRANES